MGSLQFTLVAISDSEDDEVRARKDESQMRNKMKRTEEYREQSMGSLQFKLVAISDSEDEEVGSRKDESQPRSYMKRTEEEYKGEHFSSHRATKGNRQFKQIFTSDSEDGAEERKAEDGEFRLEREKTVTEKYKGDVFSSYTALVGNQESILISTSDSEDEDVGEGAAEKDDSPLKQNKMEKTEDFRGSLFSTNRATMGNRRFTVVSTSDSDEETLEERRARLQKELKPVGEVIKVTGKIRLEKRNHYNAFEYERNRYELEDAVVVVPEDTSQSGKLGILKDITQDPDGNMMVTVQRLYFPEEAKKSGGERWEAGNSRELFYSFQCDEVPAKCLQHKCEVHFVPLHNQPPGSSQHSWYIVQRIYDPKEKKLWSLTDNDYVDDKQREIDLLVQKTRERIGINKTRREAALPDHKNPPLKRKRSFRKDTLMSRCDVSKLSYGTTRKTAHQHRTAESNPKTCSKVSYGTTTKTAHPHQAAESKPQTCPGDTSEFHAILSEFKVLRGDIDRDKCLEMLLRKTKLGCGYSKDVKRVECLENVDELSSQERGIETRIRYWPDAVVSAVDALEEALHGDFGCDIRKYNQKTRTLSYNLSTNELLARRFVEQELKASVLLKMSSDELKNGRLVTEETGTSNKPAEEEPKYMQETDYRCPWCLNKKVCLKDIIKAGNSDRYQYECTECSWYTSSNNRYLSSET